MMALLGALSRAWISAHAWLPRNGWEISGLRRFGDRWVARFERPTWDDFLSGCRPFAD
jgi:hypothetical protein